jgi:4-nitrophenyl phosphatase
MNFSDITAIVADMDGVLWRGDMPLPGLVEFFDMLRARNLPYVLATNNSAKSPMDYVVKLERMGVPGVPIEQVVNSGIVSVIYLKSHYPPGTRVHILGGDGLRQLVYEAGYTLSDDGAEVVIVGLDPLLDYERLKKAVSLIRAGAFFIGTNPDPVFPTNEGLVPGAGSIVAAVQTAAERQPVICGKPFPPMFEAALRILGTRPDQTLMIGDRIATDIDGAQQLGLHTALVLTGVTTRDELATSTVQPDGVFEDLYGLIKAFAG